MESVSLGAADKPAAPKIKTPEQLAKMLASGCRFSSKALVIVLLDLEEKYVMTERESKAIADPAARMLMRVKALRRPIRWLTGNSDELALLAALGSYGMRLVEPVSIKIDTARTASAMKRQLAQKEATQHGTHATPQAPVTPADRGSNQRAEPGANPNGHGPGIAFGGFAPEPVENGAFIIPGVGIGFSQ